MALSGFNPEKKLPGYAVARMAGHGAADFAVNALSTDMDCNRNFYQAGIICSEGSQRYLVRPGQRHPNRQSGIVKHIINPGMSNKDIKGVICAGLYPKCSPGAPRQVEITRQRGQVVTSAATLTGSAGSDMIAAPGNGQYVVGTIQLLAVF
ncbi:MAG TPA: hypothetical protein DEF05_07345 [Erwinia sp.]|nr:hypothetical protein [Erwinia sp.]